MRLPARAAGTYKSVQYHLQCSRTATEIDRRLCLVEFGIGGDNSIVLLVQSPPCGHLLELLAGWDALQHGCIVNLTGVDNKAFCDPETDCISLMGQIRR
jgi:hypothetical protein